MSRTLRLHLPDAVYEALAKRAEEIGQPPEALASDWLASTLRTAPSAGSSAEDPLEPFIGAFKSSAPEWTDDHDQHLGQALAGKINAGGEHSPDA